MATLPSESVVAASPRKPSPAKAWSRALELTARITRHPHRTLPIVVDELAAATGDAPALLSDDESFTYRQLADRSIGYARWAREHHIARGDVVCLLMPNRPEYLALWLGITRIGGVVALLNTNLAGPALAHCINVASPTHVIASADFIDRIVDVLHDLAGSPDIWIHGAVHNRFPRVDDCVDRLAGDAGAEIEEGTASVDDCALYIYTSGTTGLPKAAKVSHARIMQWSGWFAGLMDVQPRDRMYNCLPMYHSVGGVLATGAVLTGGGSIAIRDRFSAREFWSDIARWDCTLFQYIGELCRYLLRGAYTPAESQHRIRLCCGNGLRGDIWTGFQQRFRIPQILEFYAATEGNVSLVNVEGEAGSIGRIPGFLAHRFPAALVKYDTDRDAPVRDASGFCVRCAANEIGEAIGRVQADSSNVGSRFEGYTNADASEQKILRDVFEAGDAWFRSGDLMRRDERGFFYFVDRAGDTFRWKGENVAASEVAAALCAFPGVADACVYGVALPAADGRAGMAALVTNERFDINKLWKFLASRLPDYARPLFLRIRDSLDVTGTFKHTKVALARDAYDPTATEDAILFNDRERQSFVRVDAALHGRIQRGEVRL